MLQTQIQVHLSSPTVTVRTVKSAKLDAPTLESSKAKSMQWYTLSPAEALTFKNAQFCTTQEHAPLMGEFPPNGHSIAAALRELLQENAIITLHGPFLCHAETLYFARPQHYQQLRLHLPLVWLQEKTVPYTSRTQHILWDRRKPAPLLPQNSPDWVDNSTPMQPDRAFVPYSAILKLLKNSPLTTEDLCCQPGESPYPWTVEIRSHSTANTLQIEQTIQFAPDWKFTFAVDDATHHKLQQLGNLLPLRLGQQKHPFWLEPAGEPCKQQWNEIQQHSQKNRRIAESSTHEAARVLAYLITPGLFERKHAGAATCRSFPWEWNLAYPIDEHQPAGALVSLAAPHPMPINCRSLSKTTSAENVSTVQVFAAPAGSVYFMEYPVPLFQDQPFLKDGRLNKVHIWRKLGYSELLWLPCPHSAELPCL